MCDQFSSFFLDFFGFYHSIILLKAFFNPIYTMLNNSCGLKSLKKLKHTFFGYILYCCIYVKTAMASQYNGEKIKKIGTIQNYGTNKKLYRQL